MNSMTDPFKLILGTMTFGPQVSLEESHSMVEKFLAAGYREIDTAYAYNDGETERILGSILKNIPDDSYSIATKVHPRITGKLDGYAVKQQLTESLNRLGRDSADILYLHFPDPVTPAEEALEMCAELYEQGLFKELGLSNYPSWMVVDLWHHCERSGWPKPAIYQGMYNGLTRRAEKELFPALRKLGIRFYAFNPLAGGILSGKHQNFEDTPLAGRFEERPNYKNRYWKKSFFEAIRYLNNECAKMEIHLVEAAYRWLAYHSHLRNEECDGIIIGASELSHLEQNLMTLKKGPLPESVVHAFEAAWNEARSESPEYFRFYKP